MTKAAKKHPPKKKHPNKPRPEPIVPLTDDERRAYGRREFAKAELHLAEAEALAEAEIAPNACAHAAYYAMYHCAAASILASGGVGKRKDFPQSHTHVIEHYGKLVANESAALAETGMMLSRAQTDRETADYDLVRAISLRDAAELAANARTLVEACNTKWRLR